MRVRDRDYSNSFAGPAKLTASTSTATATATVTDFPTLTPYAATQGAAVSKRGGTKC